MSYTFLNAFQKSCVLTVHEPFLKVLECLNIVLTSGGLVKNWLEGFEPGFEAFETVLEQLVSKFFLQCF